MSLSRPRQRDGQHECTKPAQARLRERARHFIPVSVASLHVRLRVVTSFKHSVCLRPVGFRFRGSRIGARTTALGRDSCKRNFKSAAQHCSRFYPPRMISAPYGHAPSHRHRCSRFWLPVFLPPAGSKVRNVYGPSARSHQGVSPRLARAAAVSLALAAFGFSSSLRCLDVPLSWRSSRSWHGLSCFLRSFSSGCLGFSRVLFSCAS